MLNQLTAKLMKQQMMTTPHQMAAANLLKSSR